MFNDIENMIKRAHINFKKSAKFSPIDDYTGQMCELVHDPYSVLEKKHKLYRKSRLLKKRTTRYVDRNFLRFKT
jgi:hypothetical protein